MIWSTAASGNLRGDLQVSISNARTTGSARFKRSSMTSIVTFPPLALTVYHLPIRMSVVSLSLMRTLPLSIATRM